MKVLVIENEKSALEELCEFIENKGHKCTPLSRGEDIDSVKDLQSHKLAIIDFKLGDERWSGLRAGYELKTKSPQNETDNADCVLRRSSITISRFRRRF